MPKRTKKKVSKRTKKKVSKRAKKRVSKRAKRKVSKRAKRKVSKRTKNKKNIKIDKAEKELIFKTKPEWVKNALINKTKYQNKYSDSIKNNNEFWKKEGKRITWIKPYKKIKNVK